MTVLTERRHLTVAGLSDWIGSTFMRLHGVADRLGGSSDRAYVIFHGEVNEDTDGPVEVCVPVADDVDTDHATRIEPAHREAYIDGFDRAHRPRLRHRVPDRLRSEPVPGTGCLGW